MEKDRLPFNALILAGGRSSRLGGVPKQELVFEGETLLQRSIAAAAGAGRTVVVGPVPGALPADVLTCREQPEFAGPAAAVAAGLDALAQAGREQAHTLVLACDMPQVGSAVQALTEALGSGGGRADALIARSEDGKTQQLAGFYRTERLRKAARTLAARGALTNASMRALLASLDVQLVTVPAGSTADVDTWDDAAALGVDAGDRDKGQDRCGISLDLEAVREEPG